MSYRYLLPLAVLAVTAVPALADTVAVLDDPLHIECSGCIDNGTNTPLPTSTSEFGFSSSPKGQTGVLTLDILVPNTINTGTFVIPSLSGFASGTPALFSTTSWIAGTLASYLGETNTSPDNPLTAYLPSTQAIDGAGVTGFFDFQFTVGTETMTGPGVFPTGQDFTLGGNLPLGSYVIAQLALTDGSGDIVNTANSGAGFINTLSNETPIPSTIWLFGTALIGLIGLGRKWAIPQA